MLFAYEVDFFLIIFSQFRHTIYKSDVYNILEYMYEGGQLRPNRFHPKFSSTNAFVAL